MSADVIMNELFLPVREQLFAEIEIRFAKVKLETFFFLLFASFGFGLMNGNRKQQASATNNRSKK